MVSRSGGTRRRGAPANWFPFPATTFYSDIKQSAPLHIAAARRRAPIPRTPHAEHPRARQSPSVAAETRMVHDVATLKPSDYRAADGASGHRHLTPAADSGTNVTGTTYFDTAKGQTVPVPDARRRYANRGTWQVVAAEPSVPATGRTTG